MAAEMIRRTTVVKTLVFGDEVHERLVKAYSEVNSGYTRGYQEGYADALKMIRERLSIDKEKIV